MRVAIVGATGVVGQTILEILDERAIAIDTLLAYASRDRDTAIVFRGKPVAVYAASTERIRADRPDVVFFASSDDASQEMAETLAAGGAFVIDNSATFRLDPRAPLVIPEVNPHAIRADHRIFPVANCTAIVLCVALAPVERAIGLASVRVATYQAVSGAGRAGLETLANEEAAGAGQAPEPGRGAFAAPIFRNVVPQVGSYDGDGDTGEEQKVVAETRKMLDRPDLHVAATTVRVPVRRAHSEVVFFETKRTTSCDELGTVFGAAPGVVFHPRGIVTPLDVEGTDLVHVARVRPEPGSDTFWQMWIVGDQLRKGAATNAVQILETLVAQGRFAVAAGAPLR
jgi:aspartate-semialdehyde dehydrogenase